MSAKGEIDMDEFAEARATRIIELENEIKWMTDQLDKKQALVDALRMVAKADYQTEVLPSTSVAGTLPE